MSDTQVIDLGETNEQSEGSRWAVNLHMRIAEADAATPVDAVEAFLDATMRYGLRNLVYTVRDRHSEDGDTVFIENGVAYTDEEYQAKLDADDASDDDESDEESEERPADGGD